VGIADRDFAVVDRALRSLPCPEAPATLLPRVMAAVAAWAQRPWYERAWFTWPLGWQVASAAAIVLTLAGVALGAPAAQAMVSAVSDAAATSVFARLSGGFDRVDATVAGARVLWRALGASILGYAAIVVLVMYAACAAVVVVINRAFFGKVMPQS
jgi:hypothetical protein